MHWTHLISYFFGGIFLANAVPHFVSGISGRRFQSPFAKPPGQGLSSASVNINWAVFNIVLGYILIERVGNFDIKSTIDFAALIFGVLLIGLFGAKHFGQFYGGNRPDKAD
jgi:hypothetical protein